MNYRGCYEEGRRRLTAAGLEEAGLDARILLEYICDTNRNDLLVYGNREVEDDKVQIYFKLIGKRSERIPLQHLTGVQSFMGLEFQVNEHVLIPRQDTEVLVETVLKDLQEGMRILDMCTGSGCILISLLHERSCTGLGVDISPEALQIAKKNADNLLEHRSNAEFKWSNLFCNVEGTFDVIVSNPPYIKTEVIDTLMVEVKKHEPMLALDGEADGLSFYRRIIADSRRYLKPEGKLYFEIGYDQAEAVSMLMSEAQFREIKVIRDYADLDRVVFGTLIK